MYIGREVFSYIQHHARRMRAALLLCCCAHHAMKLPMATNADSSRIHHWKAEPARPLHSIAAAAAAVRHDSYQSAGWQQHVVLAS
jgi:hypothetical protein